MGIEYRANLGGPVPPDMVSDIVGLFSSQPDYVVMRVEGNSIVLKFAATEPRPDWPEDVQIDIEETGIYVLFHWSTRAMRERFLSFICATVSARNLKCEFEEV